MSRWSSWKALANDTPRAPTSHAATRGPASTTENAAISATTRRTAPSRETPRLRPPAWTPQRYGLGRTTSRALQRRDLRGQHPLRPPRPARRDRATSSCHRDRAVFPGCPPAHRAVMSDHDGSNPHQYAVDHGGRLYCDLGRSARRGRVGIYVAPPLLGRARTGSRARRFTTRVSFGGGNGAPDRCGRFEPPSSFCPCDSSFRVGSARRTRFVLSSDRGQRRLRRKEGYWPGDV